MAKILKYDEVKIKNNAKIKFGESGTKVLKSKRTIIKEINVLIKKLVDMNNLYYKKLTDMNSRVIEGKDIILGVEKKIAKSPVLTKRAQEYFQLISPQKSFLDWKSKNPVNNQKALYSCFEELNGYFHEFRDKLGLEGSIYNPSLLEELIKDVTEYINEAGNTFDDKISKLDVTKIIEKAEECDKEIKQRDLAGRAMPQRSKSCNDLSNNKESELDTLSKATKDVFDCYRKKKEETDGLLEPFEGLSATLNTITKLKSAYEETLEHFKSEKRLNKEHKKKKTVIEKELKKLENSYKKINIISLKYSDKEKIKDEINSKITERYCQKLVELEDKIKKCKDTSSKDYKKYIKELKGTLNKHKNTEKTVQEDGDKATKDVKNDLETVKKIKSELDKIKNENNQ